MGPVLITWYQNVDGVTDAVFKDPRRKESNFWGEGKWNTFIKPLLPRERRVFVEIGCNAGLFLKLAMDEGFENAIGIDSSQQRIKQAKLFRESNGYPYKLVQQKVGEDFELSELPLADVTLLANVHYYFPISVFAKLADHLRSRTLYCIVVSARVKRRMGMARHYLESVRGYFRDWQEIKVVGDWEGHKPVDTLNDPAPRGQMYGVLFKGGLDSYNVEQECHWWAVVADKAERHGRVKLKWATSDFFRKVLNGEAFDFAGTPLYEYWKGEGWLAEDIEEKLTYNKVLAKDIQRDGLKEPLYYDGKRRLLDGGHRLVIARELGYEHILVRRL